MRLFPEHVPGKLLVTLLQNDILKKLRVTPIKSYLKDDKDAFSLHKFYVTKNLVKAMKEENKRPWGYYEVLSDAPDHKVKRIVVNPGGVLSLQRHKKRAEHWFVVAGAGTVTLGKNKYPVKPGSAIDIPQGAAHRMENTSSKDLVLIEIQTGTYFGEDDIKRLEDKYGRV